MRTRTLIGSAAAAVAVALTAAPAGAHVTIEEPEHAPGAYTVLTFQNGHGCEGSPTTQIDIQIPEPILDVTPTRHPFYDVEVTTEALPEPVEGAHGEQVTERESVVTYTATEPLPDGYRDAFAISMRIPAEAAGETLYFPVVQGCEEGETAWIEIPSEGQSADDLESPAPSIQVTDEVSGGHGGGSHGAQDPDGTVDGDGASTDAEGGATDGEAELASTTTDTETDDGSDTLAIVALVVGALGLVVGAAGFVTARKAVR